MTKKRLILWTALGCLSMVMIFQNCSKDEDAPEEIVEMPSNTDEALDDFIWQAMNDFYLYYEDVPELANGFDENRSQYEDFLASFDYPEELFSALMHPSDRFSAIVDDKDYLIDVLQGNNVSSGFLPVFYFEGSLLKAYVGMVVPGSPAETAGLKRGDIITKVGDQLLNTTNANNLIQPNVEMIISRQLEDTTATQELVFKIIGDNTPNLGVVKDTVFTIKEKEVGYINYSGFYLNSHELLVDVFRRFEQQGATENIILDLRYNSGGAVLTQTVLTSLLKKSLRGEYWAKSVYNDKLPNDFIQLPYIVEIYDASATLQGEIKNLPEIETMNLYILTSENTASASEMTMLGFDPIINTQFIGTQTVGKTNINSVFIDCRNMIYTGLDDCNAEPSHNYGLYLTIGEFANIQDQKVPYEGFEPDHLVSESDYVNQGLRLGEFGDWEHDPLLAQALEAAGMDLPGIAPVTKFLKTKGLPRTEVLPIEKKLSGGMVLFNAVR